MNLRISTISQAAIPLLYATVISCITIGSTPSLAVAQNLEDERSAANKELLNVFNQRLTGQRVLDRVDYAFTPGTNGCPEEESNSEQSEFIDVELLTGNPGEWAGRLDGINLTINEGDKEYSGLALPSRSTALFADESAQLDFTDFQAFQEGMINLSQDLLTRLFSCYSKLSSEQLTLGGEELILACDQVGIDISDYPTNELEAELSPRCVIGVSGVLKPVIELTGVYDLEYREQLVCDLRSVNPDAGGLIMGRDTCSFKTYTGQVEADANFEMQRAFNRKLSKKGLKRVCTKEVRRRLKKKNNFSAKKLRKGRKQCTKKTFSKLAL